MGTLTSPITHDGHRLDEHGVTPVDQITTPSGARKVWAATRISLGFVFPWAFLDKAFALGFSTGRAEDGSIDDFAESAAGGRRTSTRHHARSGRAGRGLGLEPSTRCGSRPRTSP